MTVNLNSRGTTLIWALGASVAVHAGIVIATLAGAPQSGVASLNPRPLIAAFAPPQVVPTEPTVIASVTPSVLATPAAAMPAPPAPPSAPASPEPAAAPRRGPERGLAKLDVIAMPLTDRNRLGDFLGRQTSEFPVEIDRPVRLDGKVVAQYPPAALRAGREGSVAVWFVVDAKGVADEIHVLDGDDEFVAEVLAAVRAARFLPAEDRLRPIRFPLSLEFDFRLGGREATAVGQASARRDAAAAGMR
ncbi:MAG: energy transducer TonB [Burkholderiales bacterium]|nr:energy transducer TonB [Burkholderiales bacterium]